MVPDGTPEKSEVTVQIEDSGLYYSNMLARIVFQSLEASVGKDNVPALLEKAGLATYIENYPPQDLEKTFDIANLTALRMALNAVYGERGGQAMALRAGRLMAPQIIKRFLPSGPVEDMYTVQVFPSRLRIVITGLTTIFANFSTLPDENFTLIEESDYFVLSTQICPFCLDQQSGIRLC